MIRARVGLSVLVCALLPAACGMRGDPLPPLRIAPAAVSGLSAQRFGDRVYVQFTVPAANDDGVAPADLERVELYALTAQPDGGRPPVALDDWLDLATLVATIVVAPPRAADAESDADTGEEAEAEAETDAGERRPAQGDEVTVIETLTPAAFEPVVDEDDERDEAEDAAALPAGPLLGPPPPRPPRRTYLALAVSGRGRESRPSTQEAVPLGPAPDPPSAPAVTYDEDRIAFTWSLPAAARRPVQRTEVDTELPSDVLPAPRAPWRYEVYDVTAPAEAADVQAPEPLHAAPLTATSFRERDPAFGVERCFAVRTVDEIDEVEVRSAPSPATCVELVDTFPPAAPTGLVAVAAAGVVNLVWTPNAEDDVAGYLVLRGRGPDAALDALTAEPVAETAWRDTQVEVGATYEYAVQAVDDALPPNVSPQSERVREQAR